MFVRYECPRLPNLTMFGRGGKKQFQSGAFITDDPVKQEAIEASDKFGCWIFKTGQAETADVLSVNGILGIDKTKKKESELSAVDIAEDGSVRAIPQGSTAPITSTNTDEEDQDVTARQEIHFAFLNAGFPPGTDINAVIAEMGIDQDGMSDDAVLEAIMPQLRPLMRARVGEDDAEAPPLEAPNKTTLNRANHDQLIQLAKIHNVDINDVMASAKATRNRLRKHFHGE
jgi:hypothetical protein